MDSTDGDGIFELRKIEPNATLMFTAGDYRASGNEDCRKEIIGCESKRAKQAPLMRFMLLRMVRPHNVLM